MVGAAFTWEQSGDEIAEEPLVGQESSEPSETERDLAFASHPATLAAPVENDASSPVEVSEAEDREALWLEDELIDRVFS